MSAGDAPLTAGSLLPLLSLGLAILVQTAVVAFFGGKLSQRMTSAEKRIGDQDTRFKEQDEKIEAKIGDQTAILIQLAEMRSEQAHTNKALDKLTHEMAGASRQLANIAMGRIGAGGELT